jgi:hypothetical protein
MKWDIPCENLSAIDCTMHRKNRNKNALMFTEIIQVGANGHPCPLLLNPPSMADFPLCYEHFYFCFFYAKYNYDFDKYFHKVHPTSSLPPVFDKR